MLKQGCDIFARNIDAKTPKKVCFGNFVFSKLLTHCENVRLREKFEDKDYYEYNPTNFNLSLDENDDDNDLLLKKIKTEKYFINEYTDFDNKLKRETTFNKLIKQKNDSELFKGDSLKNNKEKDKDKNQINNKKEAQKEINQKIDINFKLPLEQKISDISSNIISEEPININSQKERILSYDSHLNEKYESFMFIKLNKSCNSEIIRSTLDNMDLSNLANINLISDICNYIISNFMTSLIPCLKSLLTNKYLEKHNFIKIELKNTIKILENVSNKVIIPVNKQKTKVSSKSIMNHKYEDDDDEKFIQDSDIMSEELVEDDNDLNLEVMKDIWINNQTNLNDKNFKSNNK